MSDLLGVFCILAFVLALLVAIGHGIWVGLAWLLGGGRSSDSAIREYSTERTHCRVCGSLVIGGRAKCPRCGASMLRTINHSDVQGTTEDWGRLAAIRQIERLWRAQKIDAALHERLFQLLQAPAAAQVHRPVAQPVPAAGPVAAPPIVVVPTVVELRLEERLPVITAPPTTGPVRQTGPTYDADAHPTEHRPLSAMLQAFLESRNIRWGELASGILIVGSAVGLVISLRKTLTEFIPYFPALVFMLGTAAIYGAGMYTLRRWRLRSTSRGLLTIAMLLVPLNFLAAVLLSQQRAIGDPLYWMAIILGLGGFGWMTYTACRELVPWTGRWLAMGIMGASAAQLVIDRTTTTEATSPEALAWLAALPVVAFLLAMVRTLTLAAGLKQWTARRAGQIYMVAGMAGFALAPAMALLVWRGKSVDGALAVLAPWITVAASAVLALGLMVFRKTLAAGWRTSGTAVALVAASAMVGVVALAWPRPDLLIAMGVINFVALTAIGRDCKFPLLHSVAVVCLAAAALLAIERPGMSAGLLEAVEGKTLAELLSVGRSAMVLTGLGGAAAAAALVLWRRKLTQESVAYLAASGILASLGFLIALVAGFWTHEGLEWATLVFAIDGVAAMAAAFAWRRSEATLAASGLALLALAHAMLWHPLGDALLAAMNFGELHLWSTVLLIHATIISAIAIGATLMWRRRGQGEGAAKVASQLVMPLMTTAVASSGVALLMSLVVVEQRFALHGGYILWVAALWLTSCLVLRSRAWIAPGQCVATLGVSYLITALCQQQGWWTGDWFTTLHVEIQLLGLSLWAVACHAVRLAARTQPALASVAKSVGVTVERMLVYGLMMVVVVLAAGDCWGTVYEQLGLAKSTPWIENWPSLQSTMAGLGGWIVLGGVAVAAGLITGRPPRREEAVLWPVLFVSVPLLIASVYDASQAAAVLAWGLGLYFVIGVVLLAARGLMVSITLRVMNRLTRSVRSTLRPGHPGVPAHWFVIGTLMLVAAVPLLWIVGGATIAAGRGHLTLPAAGSWFDGLGPAVTWCMPLVLLSMGLAIVAMRERKSWLALPACGALMAATVLSNVIPTWLAGRWIDAMDLAVILQQTAIAAASLAIAWQLIARSGRRWWPATNMPTANAGVVGDLEATDALPVQLFLVGLLGPLLSLWPAAAIFVTPDVLPAALQTLGQWPSYVAILLSALSFGLAKGYLGEKSDGSKARTTLAALGFVILAIPLAAASVAILNSQTPWLSFHILSGGWAALAIAATGIAFSLGRASALPKKEATLAIVASTGLSILTLACAVRGVESDPLSPWWSTRLVMAVATIAAAHAIVTRREVLAYLTTGLGVGALLIYWFGSSTTWSTELIFQLAQQLICLVAVVAIAWQGVKLRMAQFDADSPGAATQGLPLTRAVLVLGVLSAGLLVSFGSMTAWFGYSFATMTGPWGWGAIACLGLLAIMMLWSKDARLAPMAVYGLGLITLGLLLAWRAETREQWALGAVTGAAAWVAVSGMAWNFRASWTALGRQLRIWQPEETVHSVWKWLPTVSVIMTLGVVLASGCAELIGTSQTTRTLAALAVALAAPGLAMFGQQHLSRRMPRFSLMIAGVAAVYLAWSLVSQAPPETFWLRMAIRTLVALGAMAALYGLGLVRILDRAGEWFTATRQSAALMGIASLASLGAVLALEVVHFKMEGGIVAITEVAQVAVVLVGLAGALLSLALLQGADPLGLSERGRMIYVYGAQIVLALLFAHVYLTMPYLFHGRLRPYWPLIVMAVSYAGVIFGMLARRAGLRVLSEPLERTGGFLPLLPALGFFFLTSEVSYSAVMAAVAVVYVLLSSNDRRLIYRVAAAVAGNAALWALMYEQGIAPWSYPSFWALPPAFSLLIASHLNRRRLTEEQLTAIRYLSITVIYLSSTGQIWLMLGQSLWPPMLLALLSVAGIFAGMALKVRAFLYQGMSFLALAVLSMIWHASRQIGHVWPWWAFGVVLGLSILALFGLFEKKRPEMLVLVEKMKRWER